MSTSVTSKAYLHKTIKLQCASTSCLKGKFQPILSMWPLYLPLLVFGCYAGSLGDRDECELKGKLGKIFLSDPN